MKYTNITITDIKKSNYSAIFNLIYTQDRISRQRIAYKLQLSLPTVTHNVQKLEEKGLIIEDGKFSSKVGRRATAYSIKSDAYYSIGVEMLAHDIEIVAINLLGETAAFEKISIAFSRSGDYFQRIGGFINSFVEKLSISSEQILGVGFAIQGLASLDGQEITYGRVLNHTGTKISVLSKYLDFPCLFFHDAKCAAVTEIWSRDQIEDSIYISLSKHLGAAVIIDGDIYMGKHGQSGTIEHMVVDPNGPLCYCGNRGCFETYCSTSSLLKDEETLDSFFTALRGGEPTVQKRWNVFLETFATSVSNIRLVVDSSFILGGHLAPYLIQGDLDILHEIVDAKSSFVIDGPFIELSRSSKHAIPRGAALHFLISFLDLL